jgi:glutamate---cysteine ligase / carboxylate-amine ligase
VIEQHFGSSLTVGVEEELWILDTDSLDLVPGVEKLVAGAEGRDLPGVLKMELHASVVELASAVSDNADGAVEKLRELRKAAAEIAEQNGMRVAASGSYPTSVPEDQEIAPVERYAEFVEYAGPSAKRQGVSGLHVHVGMPDADTCFRVMETILPWLPLVLALSANSPYLAGRETGMFSTRAEVLGLLPRYGAPPAFRDYAEWEAFIERLRATGVAREYTSYWWDVRIHPHFGTLEIRMPDQPTSLERTAAFVSLLRDLCGWAMDAPPRAFDPVERGIYAQNRWAAARFGAHAELIHPDRDEALGVSDLARELPVALDRLDPAFCEAELQLEVGRKNGLHAVCADLVERSLA